MFAGAFPAQFLLFLPLVGYDERGEFEGRLAQNWAHSPDYRMWTFHLRRGVNWHDGVPVTAHDLKFTWDLFEVMWGGKRVATPEAPDDSTFVLRYDRPTNGLDWWTVYYPRHLLQGLNPKQFMDWDFWQHPVGNGPYRFLRHVPKTAFELEANPDYVFGQPRIKRVIVKLGPQETAVTELLSGNVDAASVDRSALPNFAGDSRFRIYNDLFRDVSWLSGIFWNHREPFFRDAAVRRALTMAIDRRELHQVLSLPDDLPLFDTVFTARQFHRHQLPEALPHDPPQARRLLDAAGWIDRDGGGVRQKDGRRFAFTALTPGPATSDRTRAAVFVQEAVRQVGVSMEIETLEENLMLKRFRGGHFQAAFWRLHNRPHGSWLSHLQLFGKESVLGYRAPPVVDLLERAERTVDQEELDRIYRELMPLLQMDVPITLLYPHMGAVVAHRRVHGLSSPFHGDPVMHTEDLWLGEGEENW
ncbi:MAG: ABC transporter substrate-binding protein [Gemmatimonadaceae bacterium]